jgi:excisionase family DNA binding protein
MQDLRSEAQEVGVARAERQRLISPADLAEFLGVPVRTVYGWQTRGIGPRSFRVGRHTRYRHEDIEAWLAERADRERGEP